MDVGVPVRVHSRAGDDLGIAHVPIAVELGDVLDGRPLGDTTSLQDETVVPAIERVVRG